MHKHNPAIGSSSVVARDRSSQVAAAPSSPLRIAWLEQQHPNLGYYDAIRHELTRRGHAVVVARPVKTHGKLNLTWIRSSVDVVLLGFGWFPMERPPLPRLPEYARAAAAAGNETSTSASAADSLFSSACRHRRLPPLVAMVNKEYVMLKEKLAWIRAHCVDAALTVHHDARKYGEETAVPFHRIWFGVDVERFAGVGGANSSSSSSAGAANSLLPSRTVYAHDLGFTGVVRSEQTANWRYRIWKQAWPVLASRGLRLFSGGPKGVHVGVTHAELNATEYVRAMRSSKLWLSTTGPADLVGTRYFEVMATGTTLCVCNRMASNSTVYESLGIKEGKHVVMFDTIEEFIAIAVNYTQRPEYDERRLAILRRAQAFALKKFSWAHVAEKVEGTLLQAVKAHSGGSGSHQHRV